MKKISGIYSVVNILNNKKYIGCSISIQTRWKTHKKLLNNNKHPNQHLQGAWNKYGKENFLFSIIEICDKSLFVERETFWIEFYSSINEKFGYNQVIPNCTKYSRHPEKQQFTKLRREVISINAVTKKVEEYPSIADASLKNNAYENRVREVCRYWDKGVGLYKKTRDKIFVYKDSYKEDFDYIKALKKIPKEKEKKDIKPYADRDIKRIPIAAYNDTEEIQFTSIKEAINKGFFAAKIYKCLKNSGVNKHRGYFWKFI